MDDRNIKKIIFLKFGALGIFYVIMPMYFEK